MAEIPVYLYKWWISAIFYDITKNELCYVNEYSGNPVSALLSCAVATVNDRITENSVLPEEIRFGKILIFIEMAIKKCAFVLSDEMILFHETVESEMQIRVYN